MSSLKKSIPAIAQQDAQVIESPVTLISAGEINLKMPANTVHNFAGVIYFNDASGDTPLAPATLTGTATITIKTSNQSHGFQSVTNGALDASTFAQANWSANSLEVKATFAAITGATHAKLIVSSNKT